MKKPARLITVVRSDLTAGYQIAQSAHCVADFAMKRPFKFMRWKLFGNYMISLAVKDLEELEQLMETLRQNRVGFVPFFEPDINEITTIVIGPSAKADECTKHLKLAGRRAGTVDKHK